MTRRVWVLRDGRRYTHSDDAGLQAEDDREQEWQRAVALQLLMDRSN